MIHKLTRQLIATAGVLLLAVAFPAVADARGGKGNAQPQPPTGPVVTPIRGADISFTLQEEQAGTTVSNGESITAVDAVLAEVGANYVRLRVWVEPPAGYSTVDSALALARRANALGMEILLDLHYSDFWADPTYQAIPASWAGQSLADLARTVQAYTADVLDQFAAQGTPVAMIQIGNEISNGILWPLGQVNRAGGANWVDLAGLLNAGIAGAREASASTQVMLHIESGADRGRSLYVMDSLRAAGVVDFDVIGLSYYAFWQSTLKALGENLNALALRYGKALVVVETSYPWTLQGTTSSSWVSSSRQLPEAKALPPTADGQAAYFTALRQVVARVPNGLGLGFFAWEPGWLPPVLDHPQGGTTQSNLAMFDSAGQPLPSLRTAFAPS